MSAAAFCRYDDDEYELTLVEGMEGLLSCSGISSDGPRRIDSKINVEQKL